MRLLTPRRRSSADDEERPLLLGGLALLTIVMLALGYGVGRISYDVTLGVVVVIALGLVSMPMLTWVSKSDDDPQAFKVYAWALAAKLAFSLVRYFVIFVVYDGLADAARYDAAGWKIAEQIRSGDPSPLLGFFQGTSDGTHRVEIVTGLIYTVTGRTSFGAFFVFSWFSYWGIVLFLKGARAAIPELDYRRAMLVVLFLPSLLFWPASVGKDALIVLGLGVIAYAAGMLLAPKARLIGVFPFALGFTFVLLLRPHIALMSVLALGLGVGFATIAGNSDKSDGGRGRIVRLLALVLLIGATSIGATKVASVFSESAGEATTTQGALDETTRRTFVGGSKFQPPAVHSPVQLPWAFVSVTSRPFPWEARNPMLLLASAESVSLITLTVVGWRRSAAWFRLCAKRPFLIFCAGYTIAFVVSFSYIGNFGILARQRAGMMQFLILPLALPILTPSRRLVSRRRPARDESDDTAVFDSATLV